MSEPEETALQGALQTGVQLRHLDDFFRVVTEPRSGAPEPSFTGALEDFTPMARNCLAP